MDILDLNLDFDVEYKSKLDQNATFDKNIIMIQMFILIISISLYFLIKENKRKRKLSDYMDQTLKSSKSF